MSALQTQQRWTHTPPRSLIIWLLISLPLVAWDAAYVFLRPLTLPPDGRLHAPFFTPYALYGSVDHLYLRAAYEEQIGLPGAQAALNVLESVLYAAYLWFAVLGGSRVKGDAGPLGVVLGLVAASMTFSKTLLYLLNEWFSGWADVGHNSWARLITLWILPNGLWIAFPLYMTWVLGRDVRRGLELAAAGGADYEKKDD